MSSDLQDFSEGVNGKDSQMKIDSSNLQPIQSVQHLSIAFPHYPRSGDKLGNEWFYSNAAIRPFNPLQLVVLSPSTNKTQAPVAVVRQLLRSTTSPKKG